MNSRVLTIAFAGLFTAACQGADPVESTTLAVKAAGTVVDHSADAGAPPTCEAAEACFHIATNGANITHVFIDVDACCASNPSDYDVLVDGQPVEKLHDNGGPCKEIVRQAWFPLQGNQASAEVCLRFHGFVPGHVSVGAKAKNECIATALDGACQACGGEPTSCGGGGAGGGATGGGGGTTGGGGGTTGSGAGGVGGTGGAGGAGTGGSADPPPPIPK